MKIIKRTPIRIYLAAPMFSKGERDFNAGIKDRLVEQNFDVVLPQETCKGKKDTFGCCMKYLDTCDVVLAVFDGPQVDDGTAFECGYAFASGIPVIGLRTDFRRVGEHTNRVNLMLESSASEICKSMDEVMTVLKRF
jgi:nucleoside 2-deoxyribosyltransferase